MPLYSNSLMAISFSRGGLTTFSLGPLKRSLFWPFVELHILEPPFLVFKFLHARHHLSAKTAIISFLFVEDGCVNTHFSANIRYSKFSFIALYNVHDLAIGEFLLSHLVPFLSGKICIQRPCFYETITDLGESIVNSRSNLLSQVCSVLTFV